jgi:hypothetical protein
VNFTDLHEENKAAFEKSRSFACFSLNGNTIMYYLNQRKKKEKIMNR